jgi:hypothetical protein
MTLWGLMFFWATQTPFRVSPTKHELDGIIKISHCEQRTQKLKIVAHDAILATRPYH